MRRTATDALLALAIDGCGSSHEPAASRRADATTAPGASAGRAPVTDEQVLVLARLLQRRYADGGAQVTGAADDGLLKRVTLDVPTLGGTGTLDVGERAKQDVELPPKSRRVQG